MANLLLIFTVTILDWIQHSWDVFTTRYIWYNRACSTSMTWIKRKLYFQLTYHILQLTPPSRYRVFAVIILFDKVNHLPTGRRCIWMLCFVFLVSLFQARSQIHCSLRCYEREISCAGYVYNATADPRRGSNCLIVIVWVPDQLITIQDQKYVDIRLMLPAAISVF